MTALRRPAMTIVELMVVITILALAVGVLTVNVHGVSDSVRLRSAADQIASIYNLALASAARTGLPHVMQFDSTGCVIQAPRKSDGRWTWHDTADLRLIEGVQIIRSVNANEPGDARQEPPWRVAVNRGSDALSVSLELATDRNARGTLHIEGPSCHWRPGDESWE